MAGAGKLSQPQQQKGDMALLEGHHVDPLASPHSSTHCWLQIQVWRFGKAPPGRVYLLLEVMCTDTLFLCCNFTS